MVEKKVTTYTVANCKINGGNDLREVAMSGLESCGMHTKVCIMQFGFYSAFQTLYLLLISLLLENTFTKATSRKVYLGS